MRHSTAFRHDLILYVILSILAIVFLLFARPAHGQHIAGTIAACPAYMEPPEALFTTLSSLERSAISLNVELRGRAVVGWSAFDQGGRRVASRDYGTLGGGAHRIIWDGRDQDGNEVAPGVYWVQIWAGHRLIIREVHRG